MRGAFALVVAALVAAPVLAQEEPGQELTGTWKRDDGKLFRLDWDAQAGEVTGKMLEPPENSVSHLRYAVDLHLHREGNAVRGKATWTDANPKKGQPNQPDFWTADSLWEYELTGPGKMKGRSEYLSFGRGKVFEKGWNEHTLERLPIVAVGSSGKAPEKVEGKNAIDKEALAGAWKLASGAVVRFTAAAKGYGLEPASADSKITGGHFEVEANVLKGTLDLAGAPEGGKVELALVAPGRLEGRAEAIELVSPGEWRRSWQPLVLERLPQIDAGPPVPEDTALFVAGLVDLPGTWKREDGLYLDLDATGEGQLVSRADGPRAHVKLGPMTGGHLSGTVTWTLDGVPVPMKWELWPQDDGTLLGVCEWFTWDPAKKAPAAKGTTLRTFKPLKKVG